MKKKGALELSIGTIVIIVIAMSLLILGIILVRQVMCAGIVLTDKVTSETESQITDLFGTNEDGIKCMGEGGQVKFGDGGSRQVICIINVQTGGDYTMTLQSAKLINGCIQDIGCAEGGNEPNIMPSATPQRRLILDSGGTWSVAAGKTTITVATLSIPRDIDASTIKLEFKESRSGVHARTHFLRLDLVPIGSFTSAIC